MSQILKQAIGDTRTHQIPLVWDGVPFEPGEGWNLIFTAKLSPDDTDANAVFQKASGAGITVSGSIASVEVLPGDTAPDRPERLYWDIQAQEAETGEIRTPAIGTMRLEGDVTRSTATSIDIITTNPPYPGGATTFTGLTDTPSSYSGQAGKSVRVNTGATALEFFTPDAASSITGLITAGTNVTLTGDGTTGTPYVINATGGASSIVPSDATFVFEGDSMTSGFGGATPWPTFAADLSNFTGRGTLTNNAVSGSTIASMTARYAATVAPLAPGPGETAYLFVWCGINNHQANTYATAELQFAALEAYWDLAIADGFRVVALTTTYMSGFDFAIQDAVNNLIRRSSKPHVIVDLNALLPDPSDTAVFNADGLHLTTFGGQVVAEIVNAHIGLGEFRLPQRSVISKQGRIGVGLAKGPQSGAHIIDAYGIRVGSTDTASVAKNCRYYFEPYSGTVPASGLIGVTNSARNEVRIGGGDPLSHAATSIGFYTASALSTVNGTEWMQINGSGLVSIGNQPGVYTTSRVSIFGTDAGLALSLTNATADNIGGYRLASANNAVATGATSGSMVLYPPANTSLEVATSASGTRIVRARIKPSGVFQLVPATTPTYATNALAVSGGLADGDVYQTANGILRIVGSAVTEPLTGGDALTSSNLDQFADVTQTSGQTLAITASTTLNGGTHSGTNTGDQTDITGNAGTVTSIGNLTGVVTSTNRATAIADGALSIAKTSGLQTALDGKLTSADVDTANTPSKIVARDGAGVINVSLINATGGQSTFSDAAITTYVEGVVAIGNSGTSQTISLTNGTVQSVTLTGNCTFTMPSPSAGKSFVLFVYSGAGGFTGTFTGVKWPGGTAPTITATASKYDIISFVANPAGTEWSGSAIQNYSV